MSDDLERLASTCIFPGFEGVSAPEWLRREVAGGLGGVVLFSWNVRDREQLAELTGAIQRERDDVLIAIDEEGGDVTRLEVDRGSSYPGNLALGAVDDIDLTRAVAGSIAAELAQVGVNFDLAPVADVNTNPRNPVIGVRSFGSDPQLVARHVGAFVEGLQSGRVAACAKHFPGHGDTETDSHLELPTVSRTLEALRQSELVPFRAAIDAGVKAIMTAHITVPAVDPRPATISSAHLHGLLREELGFDGMVFTDALEMRAISETVGVEQGAVLALAAGADALCLGHDLAEAAVESVRSAIVGAVQRGELAEDRLIEAAGRVVSVGQWSRAATADGSPDPAVGLVAARRALHVEGDARLTGTAFVVECVPETTMAADPSRHSLAELLEEVGSKAESVQVSGPVADATSLLESAHGRALVLVIRDPQRHEWERSLAGQLVSARPDTVVVDVGYPAWRPPSFGAHLTTYGAGRANLAAAAEILVARTAR